ncbi:hypothetical protein POVWA2_030110 [Plasmodium ovale wallikeri]|uniref:Uncharacterized protein n=1 Tax=Plasmodium ovale wallikeri TaxID=864142 RepID=A0A1A8YXI4_PLAOA|nr:hypothetical protein POVWA2_030110 [Plasmodium ovale wallikeri]
MTFCEHVIRKRKKKKKKKKKKEQMAKFSSRVPILLTQWAFQRHVFVVTVHVYTQRKCKCKCKCMRPGNTHNVVAFGGGWGKKKALEQVAFLRQAGSFGLLQVVLHLYSSVYQWTSVHGN